MIPEEPLDVVRAARSRGAALPAFNVNNMETIQAVIDGAEECRAPVFLQISPGAIAYAGYETLRSIAFAGAERATVPILVHLDHCRNPALVRRAIDDGFPSVMFDGSALSLGKNVATTRKLVAVARERGTLIEAELGIIGGSESMTVEQARDQAITPEAAGAFVESTGVHVLAPAIGSLHRMPDDAVSLDLDLLRSIAKAAGCPLALHGGSGVRRAELAAAIDVGVVKVNVSSRVGRVFAAGIRSVWAADPLELDLRRYLGAGRDEVRRLVVEYIGLCGVQGSVPGDAPRPRSGSSEEPE